MKIALLGAGLMGQALAEHLLQENQQVTVFNRNLEKVVRLVDLGAKAATTAQAALETCDIAILMLSDANAIQQVIYTILPRTFINKTIIQMATIAPEESRDFDRKITNHGGRYLECPVLGSLPEARTGTLILMASGHRDHYQRALPLLNLISKEVHYFGDIGQSATVKLALNQLIAGLTSSFSLSLALVEKEGINIEQFMLLLKHSALYAPTFDKKLDRMLARNFANPNFPTKHLAKDTDLFLKVAKLLDLETCALEGISQLLDKTLTQGLANTDYSALFSVVSQSDR